MTPSFKQHLEEITGDISADEFKEISSYFRRVKKRKHQFLVEEGESVGKEYWVIKGCLKAYYLDQSGKEHILQFSTENWWATDHGAFFKQEKATLFIDCVEDCELLVISFEDREELCRISHRMEHFWRVKSNYGYVALQRRILSLLRLSAEERYLQLIETYPDLIQRVPKRMIASYLGVSRETLSRLQR